MYITRGGRASVRFSEDHSVGQLSDIGIFWKQMNAISNSPGREPTSGSLG